MSILKMTYDIARDIKAGKMTRDDALIQYGHIIDMDTLDEVLVSLDCVRDEVNEGGEDIIVIQVPDSWKPGCWTDEDSPPA